MTPSVAAPDYTNPIVTPLGRKSGGAERSVEREIAERERSGKQVMLCDCTEHVVTVLSKVDDFATFKKVEVQKFYFLESRSSVKIFYFLESRK